MVAGDGGDLARGAQLAGGDGDRHAWALAEGEVGGAGGSVETYILIANTSATRRRRAR